MAVEIAPHLWLGDANSAVHLPPDVAMVINCTKNLPFYGENTTNVRIPVDDLDDPREQQAMLQHWTPDLFDSMLSHMIGGRNVLVHCQMGRQRSAATVAAFLMTGGTPMAEAIMHIRSKKREAFFPAPNFKAALVMFEASLKLHKGLQESTQQ